MDRRAPISVVIPTLDAAASLPATLASLSEAAIGGLVREVVISDGGSSDGVEAVAEAAGARLVAGEKGRGGQLARGADAAQGRWFLFLHADTALEPGWEREAWALIARSDEAAGVFTLKFDAPGILPALVSAGAMVRTRMFASPYGDQGLLISRSLYQSIGGYRPLPLFEDVDIIDRLVRAKGKKALVTMKSRAVTSADRYRREGYLRRVFRNARCLAMFRLGVPPEKIAAMYG